MKYIRCNLRTLHRMLFSAAISFRLMMFYLRESLLGFLLQRRKQARIYLTITHCAKSLNMLFNSEARERMIERFGREWAFQYDEKSWYIDPKTDEDFKFKARMHGFDPNRTEPISQAELYDLREIK